MLSCLPVLLIFQFNLKKIILIAVKIDTYIHTSMMAKLIPMILLKTESLDKKTRRTTRHFKRASILVPHPIEIKI